MVNSFLKYTRFELCVGGWWGGGIHCTESSWPGECIRVYTWCEAISNRDQISVSKQLDYLISAMQIFPEIFWKKFCSLEVT